jgi:predicted porin
MNPRSLVAIVGPTALAALQASAQSNVSIYGVIDACQYDLSKRTALYSSITRFKNEANAGAGGLGRYASAIPAGLTGTRNTSLTEVVAGMRHSL